MDLLIFANLCNLVFSLHYYAHYYCSYKLTVSMSVNLDRALYEPHIIPENSCGPCPSLHFHSVPCSDGCSKHDNLPCGKAGALSNIFPPWTWLNGHLSHQTSVLLRTFWDMAEQEICSTDKPQQSAWRSRISLRNIYITFLKLLLRMIVVL